jgi:hypothetical protein
VPCTVSARLRRRTKIRGFHTSAEHELARLRAENEELRGLIQASWSENNALQIQVSQLSASTASRSIVPATTGVITTGSSTIPAPSAEKSALIIRHMGRLVPDCDGVERFAGSTTGVHFVLSVQQALHKERLFSEWFPENCFRMHIFAPLEMGTRSSEVCELQHEYGNQNISELTCLTPALVVEKIRHFATSWSFLCPAIASNELSQRAVELMAMRKFESDLSEETRDHETLFQILLVVLITDLERVHDRAGGSIWSQRKTRHLHFAERLLPRVTARGQLMSVQCLVLLSLFYHLTGRHSLNINIRGSLLQMAQSLGLHRHSRRFKLLAGEVEMRKRLWWYIYILDKCVFPFQGPAGLLTLAKTGGHNSRIASNHQQFRR